MARNTKTAKLSHQELLALRDMALRDLKNTAGKAADFPEDAKTRLDVLGAAHTFGALNKREGEFYPCPGPRDRGEESVDIAFTDDAWRWLAALRGELRGMLDDQRGSCEIGEESQHDAFVLFILDGFTWERVDERRAVSA